MKMASMSMHRLSHALIVNQKHFQRPSERHPFNAIPYLHNVVTANRELQRVKDKPISRRSIVLQISPYTFR